MDRIGAISSQVADPKSQNRRLPAYYTRDTMTF